MSACKSGSRAITGVSIDAVHTFALVLARIRCALVDVLEAQGSREARLTRAREPGRSGRVFVGTDAVISARLRPTIVLVLAASCSFPSRLALAHGTGGRGHASDDIVFDAGDIAFVEFAICARIFVGAFAGVGGCSTCRCRRDFGAFAAIFARVLIARLQVDLASIARSCRRTGAFSQLGGSIDRTGAAIFAEIRCASCRGKLAFVPRESGFANALEGSRFIDARFCVGRSARSESAVGRAFVDIFVANSSRPSVFAAAAEFCCFIDTVRTVFAAVRRALIHFARIPRVACRTLADKFVDVFGIGFASAAVFTRIDFTNVLSFTKIADESVLTNAFERPGAVLAFLRVRHCA